MNCVNCGYLLSSSNIKECPLCGMRFPQICHSCGQPNPYLAKFCFQCGSKIVKEEMESSIQNFGMLSDRRKNVAVVFADVSGFTALSEKMDPEEVREIINDCFEYITKPIYRLEGTIDKYIGDCIMILFGAKYSHRDDPRRAVECALRMLELINEFSEKRLSRKGMKLDLSIGINFGLVVTGSVGNYFDKDYTVMGDVVNTAQRLQTNAGKGKVLVSESVYLETKDIIQYADPWEIKVKNKEKPVVCYSPKSFTRLEKQNDLYLVQRDQELSLLHSAYNKIHMVSSISVTGESGIGKTSLIEKFLSQIDREVKSVHVYGSSIYQKRVHYILTNILYEIFNITSENVNDVKQKKVFEYISYILSDYEEEVVEKNYHFICLVMGLERDKSFQDILNSMRYKDIEREILNQLTLLFTAICKRNTYMFIIEDFQWADASSRRVLKGLIEDLPDIRAIFIFSFRNQSEDLAQVDNERHVHIELKSLDKQGIHEIACKSLGCKKIDTYFQDMILQYTHGNPLYIKELINSVMKKNQFIIKDNIAYGKEMEILGLKNTIENIILSNLSDLDETSMEFLQFASIFGKEFRLTWVTRLLNKPIKEETIVQLLQLNIISLKSVSTLSGNVEKTYLFTQDTVREVIYSSILKRSKKQYHKAVVTYIESTYFAELDKYYEILCIHCENAELDEKAADYYYKTAIKYKEDFKLDSSLEYYDRFIQRAKRLDDSKIVRAYMEAGYIYTILSQYENALEKLQKALGIVVHSEDEYAIKLMISKIYMRKGMFQEALEIIDEITPQIRENSSIFGQLLHLKCSILQIKGDTKILSIAEKAEEILSKARDYESLSGTLMQAGILYFIKGETENSLYYLNKAYYYAEKINNLAAMASSSGNLGIIYHASGRISKALECFTKSIQFSKKISNPQDFVPANINLGILYLDKGLFDKAEALFKESLKNARKFSMILYECGVLSNLGDVMYEKGNTKEAKSYYECSLEISKSHGLPIEEGINYIGLAQIHLELGELPEASVLLERSYNIFIEAEEISYLSDYNRYMSIYLLGSEKMYPALEYCEKAISKAVEAKNDLRKLKALRLKGNILSKLLRYGEGIEVCSQAIALSIQLESDYEAAKSYYRRFKVHKAAGLNQEAEKDLQKARELVRRIEPCRWMQIIQEGGE